MRLGALLLLRRRRRSVGGSFHRRTGDEDGVVVTMRSSLEASIEEEGMDLWWSAGSGRESLRVRVARCV